MMKMQVQQMPIKQTMPCPNCGKPAERVLVSGDEMTRTQCGTCDYLMITCRLTGKVIEAYAPGVWSTSLQSAMQASSLDLDRARSIATRSTQLSA